MPIVRDEFGNLTDVLADPKRKGVTLPPPTRDQLAYLERIRKAGEDYDGSAIIGGPKTMTINKTIGAVTATGFEPAYLNASRKDDEFPERVHVTLRSDSEVPGQCGITVGATFTKEQFALFLIHCQQNL